MTADQANIWCGTNYADRQGNRFTVYLYVGDFAGPDRYLGATQCEIVNDHTLASKDCEISFLHNLILDKRLTRIFI